MDPLTGAALAGLGGSLFSSAASVASSERQMRFQERMSNTALQRMTRDARAAGINPLFVAGGGGASTPMGSTFEVADPVAAMNSAKQAQLARRQADSDWRLTDATRHRTETEQLYRGAEYDLLTALKPYQVASAREGAREAKASADLAERDARMGTSPGGEVLEWIRRVSGALPNVLPVLPLGRGGFNRLVPPRPNSARSVPRPSVRPGPSRVPKHPKRKPVKPPYDPYNP